MILCHYAMPFHRAAYGECCYMLYGHIHNTREYAFLEWLRSEIKDSCTRKGFARGNFINVGCMMPWIDYTPRTLEEIIRREAEYLNLPEERLNAIEEQLRQRVGELLTLSDCEEKEELEESLPDYVHASIEQMKRSWAAINAGKEDTSWDIYWCELQADINFAEHERQISPDQARFLRKKYLRI